MSEALDIDALIEQYVGPVFDETEFVFAADDLATFARACGETAPRFTDPAAPDFQASPTMPTRLQPTRRFPKGFPSIAGLGMDAGKAVQPQAPIRPGVVVTARTHLHEIYTKTGRSGRMVFFVNRMELTDLAGSPLALADTRIVIREKPDA